MDPAFAGTRGSAPNQNIENNPMQSNKVPLAWMLYTRKHLTCRANHRHSSIIAQLETAHGPAKRLLPRLQAKNSDN
jgi:hypothetical protein